MTENKIITSISLDKAVKEKIEAQAKIEHRSFSQQAAKILADSVESK